ncbi:MAG: arginine--tRNA ligase [Candidatus Dependentiae bacterium]|nr:arginine--tRNA ligase [Candidatus Dependentiae bacterium]
MNIIKQIEHSFTTYLTNTFNVEKAVLAQGTCTINTDEQKQDFGHLNANTAMILAKKIGKSPREIAQQIVQEFKHPAVEKIEIAGPGFLNFFLTQKAFTDLAHNIFTEQESFFKLDPSVPKKVFNLEFVSANPTGPLHFGHGRGGIIGSTLGNVLNFIGHKAIREFYINDAGAQIVKLGKSFKIRCQQAAGLEATLPEEAYHGEYLLELAKTCLAEKGTTALQESDEFFQTYAKNHMLEQIKHTLAEYRISFDVWFSEKTLHESGAIDRAIEDLREKGHLYEQDGALWFRSTTFGDDKDRVLKKSDGEMTYVAADIAYMKNKIDRGADHLLMVLGHDHHSYVTRLQGLLQALDLGPQTLDVILYQLVKMKASGQVVRMSKRAGNIVTLEDVIAVVGADVARFFYLNRKADAQLEFDIDLALKKTEENPVYYVQYAYVRTGSIIAKAAEISELANITEADAKYLGTNEALLLLKITSLKSMLETISTNHQTHLLTHYILELAQNFHAYYAKNRVIDLEHLEQSRGRLFLTILVRTTMATVLKLLEVSQPEKM